MRRLSSSLLGSMLRRQLNRKEMNSSPTRRYQSHSHFFLFSKSMAVDKSYQHYSNLLNFSCRSIKHYVHFSTISNREGTEHDNNHRLLQVEIVSKELIKPAVPTPGHLRMHELSLLDQLFPNVYSSFVYFYHNDDQHSTLKRRQILKQSLSKILTKFYPLAGRFIKDDRLHVDCNDDGVYYVEAKVDDHLSDFLKQPDNKSIHDLLPFHPNSVQSLSLNNLAMVQVTEFGCGGIAIGTYTSHKLMDGTSIGTFLKAWATAARTASPEEIISPSFIMSSILPSNPALSQDAATALVPLFAQNKTATRRFLFRASSLATLKKKLNSSRVLAVKGLIWKCVLAAYKARSKATTNCTTPESSSLTVPLSIRGRLSPPLPPNSIGNIFVVINPPIQCRGDEDLGVDTIVQRLKDSTNKINSEFLQQMAGYWLSNTEAVLDMMNMPYSDKTAKHMIASSMCRTGLYETDFGWGKPTWVSVGNGDSDFPYTANLVVLMDTRWGNGIEAWVTLHEEDMDILEHDPELLAFASIDPSPLESVE